MFNCPSQSATVLLIRCRVPVLLRKNRLLSNGAHVQWWVKVLEVCSSLP